jgi:YD repeat-containing protein
VAVYAYTGVGMVVQNTLSEPNVFTLTHATSMGDYPRLDVFNRVTDSRWQAANPTPDELFYRVSLTYDRNGNILTAEDHIHTNSGAGLFDAKYTIDNLDRVLEAREGNLSGGNIANTSDTKRDQIWTLDQLGNWETEKLDLSGGAVDWDDPGEYQMDGTFNTVNEWTGRDLNTDASGGYEATYTLTYDANGNIDDDEQNYEYVYDAFNRLVEVENQSSASVTLYRYNGLGMLLSWLYNNDGTPGIGGGDRTFNFAYDLQWRRAATCSIGWSK